MASSSASCAEDGTTFPSAPLQALAAESRRGRIASKPGIAGAGSAAGSAAQCGVGRWRGGRRVGASAVRGRRGIANARCRFERCARAIGRRCRRTERAASHLRKHGPSAKGSTYRLQRQRCARLVVSSSLRRATLRGSACCCDGGAAGAATESGSHSRATSRPNLRRALASRERVSPVRQHWNYNAPAGTSLFVCYRLISASVSARRVDRTSAVTAAVFRVDNVNDAVGRTVSASCLALYHHRAPWVETLATGPGRFPHAGLTGRPSPCPALRCMGRRQASTSFQRVKRPDMHFGEARLSVRKHCERPSPLHVSDHVGSAPVTHVLNFRRYGVSTMRQLSDEVMSSSVRRAIVKMIPSDSWNKCKP